MQSHYFAQETGEDDELPGFSGINKPGLDGLEDVVGTIEANDLWLTSTRNGRMNMNGPCLVYVPVVNKNGTGHHKLDEGKTQGSSHGWAKEELQAALYGVPKTKIYTDFNYNAFAARKSL